MPSQWTVMLRSYGVGETVRRRHATMMARLLAAPPRSMWFLIGLAIAVAIAFAVRRGGRSASHPGGGVEDVIFPIVPAGGAHARRGADHDAPDDPGGSEAGAGGPDAGGDAGGDLGGDAGGDSGGGGDGGSAGD